MMRWLVVLVVLLMLGSAWGAAPVLAQDAPAPRITNRGVDVDFAQQITFSLNVQPVDAVSELIVVISPEGSQSVTHQVDLSLADAEGNITQPVDALRLPLYPFSQVAYHYEASLKDGSLLRGEPDTFRYDDDRFDWKEVVGGIFQVYWYGSDIELGSEILNIAQTGLDRAQTVLLADPPTPLRIYAYSSSKDLQAALQISNKPWIAGHATPQLNLILISVPSGPERKLELERQIPHEIMHILQYQVVGDQVEQQPLWLIEGLASLAELYPNPEYSRVLAETAADRQIMPMRDLCAHFPDATAQAFQAYAQSDSFVRYLQRKYGASRLRMLMEQYQNGIGCEEGVQAALGESLTTVEKYWQQEALGINQQDVVISNLSPYLLLSLLLLIPAFSVFLPVRPRPEEDQ